MTMETPELLLQNLNRALRELRGAAHLLHHEPELMKALHQVMRRLAVAELFNRHSVIVIAGSQGAGKTTLLRTMYDLHDPQAAWLQPNIGRGEKVPVLVVEDKALMAAQGFLRVLEKTDGDRYVEKDIRVDVQHFHAALSGDRADLLIPVLKVPRRYFERPSQAWLLLPGYEKINEPNREWQALMRQAMTAAAGCVVVSDQTRIANQQDADIVKDMLASQLPGCRPVVVLSKSEALSQHPDRVAALRKQAANLFNLSDEQAEWCVVFTRTNDLTAGSETMEALKHALTELATLQGTDRKIQLARLDSLLTDDLAPVLSEIRNQAQSHSVKEDGATGGSREQVKECLEAFDNAHENLQKEYRETIDRMLKDWKDTAQQKLKKNLASDHEGFLIAIKGAFDTHSEGQIQLEQTVMNSWSEAGDMNDTFNRAMSNLTRQELGAPPVNLALESAPGALPLQRLGYIDEDKKLIDWRHVNEPVQRDLVVLLSPTTAPEGARLEDPLRAIQLLPALTLEYARAANLEAAVLQWRPEGHDGLTKADPPQIAQQSASQMTKGIDLSQTVLRGVAAILVADIAVDGKADILDAASKALGAPGLVAASASGVLGAISGFLALAYLAKAAAEEVHKHDVKGSVMAHSMLAGLSDQHLTHFMSRYDKLMRQVRARLVMGLSARYRLDDQFIERDRLFKALVDARAAKRDLLDELSSSGQSLQLFPTNLGA